MIAPNLIRTGTFALILSFLLPFQNPAVAQTEKAIINPEIPNVPTGSWLGGTGQVDESNYQFHHPGGGKLLFKRDTMG